MTGYQNQGNVPVDAPYYGATLTVAFKRFWKKYATFTGRASRSEYWWWVLIYVVVQFVLQLISGATGGMNTSTSSGNGMFSANMSNTGPVGVIIAIWSLATLIPSLALTVRRLHDANFRGWWIFLELIPVLGWIAVLIMVLQPSKPAGQRFDRYAPGAAPPQAAV